MSTSDLTRDELRELRDKLLEYAKIRKPLIQIGWRTHFINAAHQLDCLDAAMARANIKKLSLAKGKINFENEITGSNNENKKTNS